MGCDWSKARLNWMTDPIRFATSPHCRDLLVISLSAFLLGSAFAYGVLFSQKWFANLGFTDRAALLTLGLAPAFAAMAWAYQSSNLRFGAADIFASEIQTLCRISGVVGFMQRLVDTYESDDPSVQPAHSTQDYVVIFHNNSKDLEILDGNVVTWVTEFYVYFKAMLDTMSRLPTRDNGKALSAEDRDRCKEILFSVLYMAFLVFESGRHALMRLIDDGHLRREAVLTALYSEIPAYVLLFREFEKRPRPDIRKQRIFCRLPFYEELMSELALTASETPGPHPLDHRICDLAKEVTTRWNQSGLSSKNLIGASKSKPAMPTIVNPRAA